MFRSKKMLALLVAVVAVTGLSSWGFLVHRTVNQLAIYQLPKGMKPFFYIYKNDLVYNAPRPDQRRSKDSTEGSKHFIDLEYFGDSAAWKMPVKWEDAIKVYSPDTLYKYGTVPYVIVDIKNRLTSAFRTGNRDSILFYAADLGHYIGDAHVPLHTSLNYDGQLTNQRGLHDLWETTVPEIVFDEYKLSDKHKARYIDKPEEMAWQIVRETHALLPEMFAQEIAVSKGFTDSTKYRWQVRWGKNRRFYTAEFAKAYNKALGESINKQLLLSAERIADFWYTAWVDAGSPDLSVIMTKPFAKKEKKQLKSEEKAYHKNELTKKGWLVSRKVEEKEN